MLSRFPKPPGDRPRPAVHYPRSYEQLASNGFDPNAEFLYALELLPQLDE
jgi:hypothetical protein